MGLRVPKIIPRPTRTITVSNKLTREQAELIRLEYQRMALASWRSPAVLLPPHQPQRLCAYTCLSCGAPVRSTEMACTYCTTERPAEQFERIDVTTLCDVEPQYLVIPQPTPDTR